MQLTMLSLYRYSHILVTCKQRGQKNEEAPISPPNPLQNLFGSFQLKF